MRTTKRRWTKIVIWVAIIPIAVIVVHLATALVVYPAEYVYRVLAWRETDVFDWQKFPAHELRAAPAPVYFVDAPDDRVPELFAKQAGVENWEAFLESQETQAFVVLYDGDVVYERYFHDTQHDSIVTSFSVAKSFTSALIGIAIEEGAIASVDDPITDYLPELAERDSRFSDITIRDLLLMSSGLEYEEYRWALFNGDDPLTAYYPDQREISLENTHVTEPPGRHFSYNKYHPQLLGMILERSTGGSVTEYLQEKLWDPLGMVYGGSWSTDSEASDFEKMETGVNARALDFAKLGQLYLDGGMWRDNQLISADWIAESTRPHLPAGYDGYYPGYFVELPGLGYYAYMWWGMARDNGSYDFAAVGDKGQFIFVSPHKHLVIVRNGIHYGIPMQEWLTLFYDFATEF